MKMNPFLRNKGGNAAGQSARAKAKFGGLGVAGAGFGLVDTYMNMKQGDDLGTAALKATGTAMLWTAAPGAMTAYTVATTLPSVAAGVTNWHKQRSEWWQQQHIRGQVGGGYQDTQAALTMRQAAVQQIQGNKLNARSALGGEARIFSESYHRG
ncbi:hypothetical protein KLEB273_gp009 [Bacillus phage vB_BauM_KLEB27-3]|nr:hypothetical protein KLEB273_gp009 [Bacillus phage vB_BauM_KLEB27-3]